MRRTALTAGGIGLAVLLAVAMLAVAAGWMGSIRDTGHPLNVLVTSRGAETMEFSAVDPRVLNVLRASPHVASEEGRPLASPELFVTTLMERGPGMAPVQAMVRGVLPVAMRVHEQVRVTEGRFPTAPGEIMVGPLAATKTGLLPSKMALGETLELEGTPWRLVGRFASPGTVFESEIWAPLGEVMTASRRQELSAIVLSARDPAALEEMLFDFEVRTDVLVAVRRETDYYADYADAYRPVLVMVNVMTGMLALGGVFIGMNTLFAAVTSRVHEIGVLRTVGYRRFHIALAFVIESMIPSVAGGLLAGLLALCLNGLALEIPMGAFRLHADVSIVALAVLLGLGIGLLGALWPVWRAVRMRTVDALRHA